MDANYYIKHLQLQPHPEGGFYKETYRSEGTILQNSLPKNFEGERSFSTAIYYLLQKGDYSGFHRIKSDECWHFYGGCTLLVHIIEESGRYYTVSLGKEIDQGETFQYVVPANAWFASEPAPGTDFSLVGCTVSPGFDFRDFEMAKKTQLLKEYPQHKDILERLCRE